MSSERTALRAALIAAILQAPDDDAPRLICADWFEEQGDEASVARAEFIRIQVERARLAPDDVRHSELEARELRLLKRYAAAWCGSHFVFKKVRFRRGFIEYVHLHLQHFLHHRRQMLALEPVTSVSLTGWGRAPDDLIRRASRCEEWKHIERLRIHHQGPQYSPRGNVLLLLESPHLTRLRALHCPLVEFDADARRRFERLTLLRQLTELRFPILQEFPHHPGEWFSGGGAAPARLWEGLRSLTLPHDEAWATDDGTAPWRHWPEEGMRAIWQPPHRRMNLLRQLSKLPTWGRLTSLELFFCHDAPGALSLLRYRLPEGLRELRLDSAWSRRNDASADSFFERLAQAPLERLHLGFSPVSAAALGRLLDGARRGQLRELTLDGCDISEEHLRVISSSAGAGKLSSLSLAERNLSRDAIRTLLSCEQFHSLTHLDLSGTPIRDEGAMTLARAKGWDRLRSLALCGVGLSAEGLRVLLESPNVRHLTRLVIDAVGTRDEPALDISPDLAAEMTRLPHLARLHLGLWHYDPRRRRHCDPRSRQLLTESDSLAWVSIDCEDGADERAWRGAHAPERRVPLDDATERQFRET
jgi:uncharacterized protein (TIGR02996 family)